MKTVKVLVKEPGKGKAVNPYAPKGVIDENTPPGKFWEFDNNNPERSAIDHKGHYLQPRDQPYECKEVWQAWDGKGPVWENSWFDCRVDHKDYERNGIETRCIYQSIEDVVKGEKEPTRLNNLATGHGFAYIQSTPVNEAKEVESVEQAAYDYCQKWEQDESDERSRYKMMSDFAEYYRATHPIENKEGVKSAEEILNTYHPVSHDSELKTDLWPTSTVLAAMREHAQFTPIEQGKMMVSVEEVEKLIADRIKAHNTSSIRNPTAQQVNMNFILKEECNFLLNQIKNLNKA